MCVICGTTKHLTWCEDCKEYLCPKDQDNWWARSRAAKDRAWLHFKNKFL